ncbi:KfrB domain-containing protein [Acidovorax carolinensis]|uniref:KfrB domain-containing protein n=1 Tax=Acidovorax carolinensis TaxID=553814 RepID=UPI001F3088AD|nr:DUF6036 family nucleotidyltransferase [Acidovorax carolinensis]
MPTNQVFHLDTPLGKGLVALFKQLEDRLSLNEPINVYLAGGMAVHLYTADRVTTDVDAEFGGRVFLPNDLIVDVALEDGSRESLYFDTNYNSTFALMHEDYLDDAISLDVGLNKIKLHVLSPLDLAVSKIARLADNDKEDISRLVRLKLTTADAIEQRATAALVGYVGGLSMLRLNLRDAVNLAREVEVSASVAEMKDALHGGGFVITENSGEQDRLYVGQIVAVTSMHAAQDIGRHQVVVHDLRSLDTKPAVGDRLDIKFKGGHGTVLAMGLSNKGLGR